MCKFPGRGKSVNLCPFQLNDPIARKILFKLKHLLLILCIKLGTLPRWVCLFISPKPISISFRPTQEASESEEAAFFSINCDGTVDTAAVANQAQLAELPYLPLETSINSHHACSDSGQSFWVAWCLRGLQVWGHRS